MLESTTRARLSVAVVAFLAVAAGSDHRVWADIGKGAQAAFRGDILFSAKPLPTDIEDDKEAIQTYKKLRQTTLTSTEVEGVPTWTLHYTAFLKTAPKTSELAIDFYTDDKEKLFVANKRFNGVSPDLTILSGTTTMSEDDNLNKGRDYLVKVTAQVKGREVVLATSKLSLK